ncbi:MAG: hypothetical protein NXI31_24865 [bacterium]|nr:hypothetical protein [bacterium]
MAHDTSADAARLAAATPPNVERALRQLFWRLLLRGRTATNAQADRRKFKMGLKLTLFIYALLGLIPGVSAFGASPIAFASFLHGMTLMFASLTLAAGVGNMLFAREEAEILLHRPVRPEQLLRAKAAVIAGYALLLALALNFIGLITGCFAAPLDWRWLPAHLLSTTLLMVFSVGLTILIYSLCLRWFGREKLDNVLTMTQALLAVVMVLGGQLAPQMLRSGLLEQFDHTNPWLLALPPVWFAALDCWLVGVLSWQESWLPTILGLGTTVLVSWLAFVRFARGYDAALQSIGEGGETAKESNRPRRLSRVMRWPLLRAWLRDPVERHAFVLATGYLFRDRETKLKIFPGIAPIVALPILLGVISMKGAGGFGDFTQFIAVAYITLVPLQPLTLLRHSEHFRTADLLRAAPLPHWAPLFHGARKAVLLWLAFPAMVLMVGIMIAFAGSLRPLAIAVPVAVLMPVCALLPAIRQPWLPLSESPADMQAHSLGCAIFAIAVGAAIVVAGIAAWLASLGYLVPFIAGMVVLSLLLQRWLTRGMLAREWTPTRKATRS